MHTISTTWVWCELEISYAVCVITGHFAYHISLATSSRTRHWVLLSRFLSSITCFDNGSSDAIITRTSGARTLTRENVTLILPNHNWLDKSNFGEIVSFDTIFVSFNNTIARTWKIRTSLEPRCVFCITHGASGTRTGVWCTGIIGVRDEYVSTRMNHLTVPCCIAQMWPAATSREKR